LTTQAEHELGRLTEGFKRLDAQRARLQHHAAQIHKESASTREQIVGLQEFAKTATNELATRIAAAERDLDRKLDIGGQLREAVEEERDRERERWERVRAKVTADLDRTTQEIREFFLVQLRVMKNDAQAPADAGESTQSAVDEAEAVFPEWRPGVAGFRQDRRAGGAGNEAIDSE